MYLSRFESSTRTRQTTNCATIPQRRVQAVPTGNNPVTEGWVGLHACGRLQWKQQIVEQGQQRCTKTLLRGRRLTPKITDQGWPQRKSSTSLVGSAQYTVNNVRAKPSSTWLLPLNCGPGHSVCDLPRSIWYRKTLMWSAERCCGDTMILCRSLCRSSVMT